MQLTDKVLLPATISYTGSEQQSTSPHSDDATKCTGVDNTRLTAEAGHSEVRNVAMSAVIEDDAEHDKVKNTNVCSVTVDNTSDCMEVNNPYSTLSHIGPSPPDTPGMVSVMTMSLINFPSDCIGDGMEMDSASSSTVRRPTAVDIDGTFLQTVDANIVSYDLGAGGDGHYTCEPESTSLICNAVSDDDGCSEVQKPTEWTRYFVCMLSCLHCV